MCSQKIAVFTAIAGGYDTLKPVCPAWAPFADFIAFVDVPPAPGWNVREITRDNSDPCRNAKQYKLLPHKFLEEYEYTVWHDGSVLIQSTADIRLLCAQYLNGADIAVFSHRRRSCIYDEATACLHYGMDDPALIHSQMANYRDQGYPANAGLAECTVIFRRNTPTMAAFNEKWHSEVSRYSRRDQLSFNYVVWKTGIRYNVLPGNIAHNDHFLWQTHTGAKRSNAGGAQKRSSEPSQTA